MKRRILFVAAAAGALLSAGGIMSAVSPAGQGRADSNDTRAATIAGVLAGMEPGAIVNRQADGSLAVQGTLTAAASEEARRAGALLDEGPATVRCDSSGTTCVPVTSEVGELLRNGATNLYSRTVIGGITQSGAPRIASGALTCGALTGGVLNCESVGSDPVVIASDETMLVTYQPMHAKVENGRLVLIAPIPAVPVQRAG